MFRDALSTTPLRTCTPTTGSSRETVAARQQQPPQEQQHQQQQQQQQQQEQHQQSHDLTGIHHPIPVSDIASFKLSGSSDISKQRFASTPIHVNNIAKAKPFADENSSRVNPVKEEDGDAECE